MSCRKMTCLLVILTWLPYSASAAEPTVYFSPARSMAAEGETISVEIAMRNFPVSQGGGVNVRFHSKVLQAESVVMNDEAWGFGNRAGEIDNERGIISNILFSSLDGVSGDAGIATIYFRTVRKGQSQRVSGWIGEKQDQE